MQHQPRKRFGQNFLRDPAVIARIVAAVNPAADDRVVEIGPGPGTLTEPLLATLERLDVIEIDRDLVANLEAMSQYAGKLQVHSADALRFDFAALAEERGGPLRLIGNLPYNISTPLLFHVLSQSEAIHDMHFMLQKEVVERMAAGPGNRTYGRLSVMLAWRCSVSPLFGVGPGAFRPSPKVSSAVVRLIPHTTPPFEVGSPRLFGEVVTRAFSYRRKTLRNALKDMLSPGLLETLDIDPSARPETLAPADYGTISRALSQPGQ